MYCNNSDKCKSVILELHICCPFHSLQQNYQLHMSENLHRYAFNSEKCKKKKRPFRSSATSVTSSIRNIQLTGFMLVW